MLKGARILQVRGPEVAKWAQYNNAVFNLPGSEMRVLLDVSALPAYMDLR